MKPQHIVLSLLGGALLPLAASAQLSITSLNQTSIINFQSNVGHPGNGTADSVAGDNVFKFGPNNARTLIENGASAWSASWSGDWGMSSDAFSWSVSGQSLYSNPIGARTPFGDYNADGDLSDSNSSGIPNASLLNRGSALVVGGRPVNHSATAGDWGVIMGNNGAPFADYTLTLRVRNNSGAAITRWTFGADTWFIDTDGSGATMSIGHSTNNTSFTTSASYLTSNTSVGTTSYDAVAQNLLATFDATVAPGEYLYLQFANVRVGGTGSGAGVILDNLSVTAIPEPSAFAALGGFAALGFAATRRRRVRA